MRKRTTVVAVVLLAGALLAGCTSQQKQIFQSVAGETHSAVTPATRTGNWTAKHERINEWLKQGNVDLLFVGDSITEGWTGQGKEIWNRYYAPRNAVNMGIGGDRTQHVLWRLDHSNLEDLKPRLAIVMIGTNNSGGNDNTAEEIADGIIAICDRLRTKLPQTKILLLAIFPRNEKPTPQREENEQASLIASKIADGRTIYYLDINSHFLTPDGTLPKSIMQDFLHPNANGYKIWAEAMEPMVAKLMGEKK